MYIIALLLPIHNETEKNFPFICTIPMVYCFMVWIRYYKGSYDLDREQETKNRYGLLEHFVKVLSVKIIFYWVYNMANVSGDR